MDKDIFINLYKKVQLINNEKLLKSCDQKVSPDADIMWPRFVTKYGQEMSPEKCDKYHHVIYIYITWQLTYFPGPNVGYIF